MNSKFENLIGYCTEDLGILNVEKNDYDLSWQSVDTSNSSEQFPTIYKAFTYTDSSVYNNYPYLGVYANYLGKKKLYDYFYFKKKLFLIK